MIDGSSCLQRRIFSEVSKLFGSEDTRSLSLEKDGRGSALCGVEVSGGEVCLNGFCFGWYLYLEVQ
jgi:hypothetical protein